jgi:hypothetical protein
MTSEIKAILQCFYDNLINPFVRNKMRFMHKARIRLHLCFNKPFREKKCVSYTKLELGCTYVLINPFVKNIKKGY